MISKNQFNISKVIQRFLPSVETHGGLSAHQLSTLKLIGICKSSALGGHRERCDNCHYSRIHYNSCGNRNCPSCQGHNKHKWILHRQHDLLPVNYFHCVFTIPSGLHIYFRYNKKLLYDLLMRCVKDTLITFGYDTSRGINGKIGGTLLLHTWTQQLTYHPHVHCIVPAGGLSRSGRWNNSKENGKFLFPVWAMSKIFRGKLMASIHLLFKAGMLNMTDLMSSQYLSTKNRLYKKDWVVYSKQAFGGPSQVLDYLSAYTHKICISNYRILAISDTHVCFRYTDRNDNTTKVKSFNGEKFIRLFAQHILPKSFVKIRHFGFLCSRTKRVDLKQIRKCLSVCPPDEKPTLTSREIIKLTLGKDPYICPCCQDGEMVVISIVPAMRGSPIRPPLRFFAKDRIIDLLS